MTGKIEDKANTPISFASVVLLNPVDSLVQTGGITDDAGNFSLEAAPGRYLLWVSFVGYQPLYQSLSVTGNQQDLGVLSLETDNQVLGEVTVEAEKPLVVRKIDRLEFNIANSIALSSGSVWDALRKTPGVVIDNRGSISISGKNGVLVMINDRMTNMSGEDLADMLRGMGADNVEAIEVITNPPARYEAEGNAGIINLRLKQNPEEGWNGRARLAWQQGVRGKLSGGVSLNYNKGPVQLYALYSGRQGDYVVREQTEIDFLSSEGTSRWSEDMERIRRVGSNTMSLAADFTLAKGHVLGLKGNAYFSDAASFAKNFTGIESLGNTEDSVVNTVNELMGNTSNQSYNLNYTGALGDNQRLSFNGDYVRYQSLTNQDLSAQASRNQEPLAYGFGVRSDAQQDIIIRSAKLDYSVDLANGMTLEAGSKIYRITADQTLDFYTRQEDGSYPLDQDRSNVYRYEENQQAAYVSLSNQADAFSYQVGLRAENTDTEGVSATLDSTVDIDYFRVFPTVYLQYVLSDDHELGASYGRRISRPEYRRLNPARNFLSPFQYSEGNPFLQPSFTHNFEVSYVLKGQYFFSAYYSQENGPFVQISVQDNVNNSILYQQVNLDKQTYTGAWADAVWEITPWWEMNPYVEVYYTTLSFDFLNSPFRETNLNYLGFLNNSFDISGKHGISAELQAAYYSRGLQGPYIVGERWDISVGLDKSLFNDRATLSLYMSDIFYKSNFRLAVDYQDQQHSFVSLQEERFFQASLSFRLGSGDVKRFNNRDSGAEDEKNRLD